MVANRKAVKVKDTLPAFTCEETRTLPTPLLQGQCQGSLSHPIGALQTVRWPTYLPASLPPCCRDGVVQRRLLRQPGCLHQLRHRRPHLPQLRRGGAHQHRGLGRQLQPRAVHRRAVRRTGRDIKRVDRGDPQLQLLEGGWGLTTAAAHCSSARCLLHRCGVLGRNLCLHLWAGQVAVGRQGAPLPTAALEAKRRLHNSSRARGAGRLHNRSPVPFSTHSC